MSAHSYGVSTATNARLHRIRRCLVDGVQQQTMQVGAVDEQIRMAVTLDRCRAKIEQLPGIAGAPQPNLFAGRLARDRLRRRSDAELIRALPYHWR
jgi:hypothetical protein